MTSDAFWTLKCTKYIHEIDESGAKAFVNL